MGALHARILISGYYGFGNSGDEAVLLSILQSLEQAGAQHGMRLQPVVLSADPAATEAAYGVQAVPRMKPAALVSAIRSSSGLISGGGSLLQDVTGNGSIPYYLGVIKLAQWLGKPTYIYSQGIGPVNRRLFQKMTATVFNKAQYVSVRDAQSASLLQQYGVRQPVEVVPDPVMGMKYEQLRTHNGDAAANAIHKGRQKVGVSVRFWREDRADLQRMADLLSRLCELTAAELLFLPFHEPHDREASEWVISRLAPKAAASAELVPPTPNPLDMLQSVGRCDMLVGMRLHALIYAAAQKIPPAGISYDPKIDRFLDQIGMPPIGSTDQLAARAAAEQLRAMLSSAEDWRRQQSAAIDKLIEKSQQPAQQIAKLLRQIKGEVK